METLPYLFERIGLGKEEASIYMAVLEAGSLSISDITRKTGLHRPRVYVLLPNLIKAGYIKEMPKGKYKVYIPESPAKLLQAFEDSKNLVSKNVEDLMTLYMSHEAKPKITFTQGKEALITAFSDVVKSLKKGDMYYRYSSSKSLSGDKYTPADYAIIRDQKQLERWIITNEPTKKRHRDRLGRAIKTIPKEYDLFDYNVTQIIYGNKVAILDYNTETAITIENPVVAEFQKKIFKLLFKTLK